MMPVSVVGVGENGWVETETSLESERATTAAAFHNAWWRGVRFFHRDGQWYEVTSATPVRRLPALSKLLANTIYNPRLTVRYEYQSRGQYELDELRHALVDAIDKDDDVLTQFHEAAELKARLNDARSFDDVVAVLRFTIDDTAA